MQIQQIPLSQLRPCENNVRKTGGTSIDDLVASIRAHGLLQNLTVRKNGKGFEVSGGARRLRALQLLEKDGQLPAALADGVPCNVVDDAVAYEASLAENTIREAMHPADEFVAFRGIVDQHKLTPAEIGERFGKSEKYVEQRLRLGNVAPKLIEEYRAGKANLEQMMALAIVDDHAAQEKAWTAGARNDYFRRPDQLRDALVERDVSLTEAIGAFVGIKAYEEAGGTPRRDLFSDFVTLPDSKLVQKLAKKKLEAEAAKVKANGWGWVEAKPEFDYTARSKYRQSSSKAPSEKLGAVVTIGHNGKVEVVAGLLKPGEKAPAEIKAAEKKKAAGQAHDKSATTEALIGARAGALRHSLRSRPTAALAALATSMAGQAFDIQDEAAYSVLEIGADTYLPATLEKAIALADPDGATAMAEWQKRIAAGAKARGGVLLWLLSEPVETTIDLLAFLITGSIHTRTWHDADAERAVHVFASELQVNFAASWTPTAAWLAKQPKAYVLEAVTEAAGKEAAKALEQGKAKDLPAAALAILVEKGWVPEQLRAPKPPEPKKPTAKKAAKKAKR